MQHFLLTHVLGALLALLALLSLQPSPAAALPTDALRSADDDYACASNFRRCPQGSCCSSHGYCGGGAGYCGDGCQAAWSPPGACGSSSSSSPFLPPPAPTAVPGPAAPPGGWNATAGTAPRRPAPTPSPSRPASMAPPALLSSSGPTPTSSSSAFNESTWTGYPAWTSMWGPLPVVVGVSTTTTATFADGPRGGGAAATAVGRRAA